MTVLTILVIWTSIMLKLKNVMQSKLLKLLVHYIKIVSWLIFTMWWTLDCFFALIGKRRTFYIFPYFFCLTKWNKWMVEDRRKSRMQEIEINQWDVGEKTSSSIHFTKFHLCFQFSKINTIPTIHFFL